ncbi:peptide-methionine (R)-S-oxide reductase MsrB [Chloroflexota bacterium]
MSNRVIKRDKEWKEHLTTEQYLVTRKKITEPPFTGKYYNYTGDGIYRCVSCGNELFSSDAKYDSRTGWPSYYIPVSEDSLELVPDRDGVRVEVLCKKCGAHLGHVFEDGPQPTGLRYCMNSVALDFVGEDAK